MDSIRKEIEAEMKRTRLDKGRLYDLLLKIIDGGVGGGEAPAGAQGPAGPRGPAGPAGPVGPAGECKCKCVGETAPVPETPKGYYHYQEDHYQEDHCHQEGLK